MDVVCLGELMIDMISSQEPNGNEVFRKYAGGAAANVAVGVARLGLDAGFIGKVGNDFLGEFLIGAIQSYGVDGSHIRRDPIRKTTMALVSINQNKVPSYLFFRDNAASTALDPCEIDESYIAGAKALYLSSIALTEDPVRQASYKVVDLARKHNVMVCFDPNVRMRLWSSEDAVRQEVLRMVRNTDILKMNMEELELLFGAGEPESLCKQIFENYPNLKLIIVTLGPEGAFAMDRSGAWVQELPVPVKVVDTTGAGDSFFSALIYHWVTKGAVSGAQGLAELVRYANTAASVTAGRNGAIPAMPSNQDILDLAHEFGG